MSIGDASLCFRRSICTKPQNLSQKSPATQPKNSSTMTTSVNRRCQPCNHNKSDTIFQMTAPLEILLHHKASPPQTFAALPSQATSSSLGITSNTRQTRRTYAEVERVTGTQGSGSCLVLVEMQPLLWLDSGRQGVLRSTW